MPRGMCMMRKKCARSRSRCLRPVVSSIPVMFDPLAADEPPLFRTASLVVAALGLSQESLTRFLGNWGFSPEGPQSRRVGAAIDAIMSVAGGFYRIRSPWGSVELQPQSVPSAVLSAAARCRILSNTGAIQGAIARGSYAPGRFPRRGTAQAVQAEARASMRTTLAKARAAFSARLPAQVVVATSLVGAVQDLLASIHATTGCLPASSVPLVTGIPSRTLALFLGRGKRRGDRLRRSVDAIMVILQAAGCTVELVVGRRIYRFKPIIDRRLRKMVAQALAGPVDAGGTPTPMKRITDPLHRRIVRLYLARIVAVHERVGRSHEFVRQICRTYGYDRRSRMRLEGTPRMGSPLLTETARTELRSWAKVPASIRRR